jgi:hypothetical protein
MKNRYVVTASVPSSRFSGAVINGLRAGPIMVLAMLMTTNRTITAVWNSRSPFP